MENSQSYGFQDRRPDALGDLKVLPDEVFCSILENLSPRDVARLSCVSSVMYILCNEEPLWMSLCLKRAESPLQYKGSWKKTTLSLEHIPVEYIESQRYQLHFDGFNSLFLYRRLYRCHTTLDGFSFDTGNVERKMVMSAEEFQNDYDAKKPVLLKGLADTWPARNLWTLDQLLLNYGDTAVRISQRSPRKILMKLRDYISYMKVQHDEDPLYIFDDKFGEVAPGLLKDYDVPHLFQEDFFDVLDKDQRPAYRWLIIGPQRSGASWHVDPALTSAWNTLLCGRKRWAFYPPGKVPLGVTVHVNEEDGDVNVEAPSSLQWWLDFYPLLADKDKPIECTQLPGETIFVPTGWWHCVLNLEPTVAVTQNFVNSKNFEFVCLDMAPGYRHKGVSRAGFLALDEGSPEECEMFGVSSMSYSDLSRKEKRMRVQQENALSPAGAVDGESTNHNLWKEEFSYDINFLARFLDKDKDHYNYPWSLGNCIGQRDMRDWLYKLWIGKPGMRELVWKGACIALNAGKWLECLLEVCAFHNLPYPTEEERLPVGMGSNPVYLVGDHVIKFFIEEGLENSMYGLGTELEFYSLLHQDESQLKNHIPNILGSGILYFEDGSFKISPWDGKGVPKVIADCDKIPLKFIEDEFPFGVWSKMQYEFRRAKISVDKPNHSEGGMRVWPYIITKRCKGKIFAQVRDGLPRQDVLNLATFLGEQLHNLHVLSPPPIGKKLESVHHNFSAESPHLKIAPAWETFIKTLSQKRNGLATQLAKWGDPIPSKLIERVDEYIPDNLLELLNIAEDNQDEFCKPCWIHSDVMDDNIVMEPCSSPPYCNGGSSDTELLKNRCTNGNDSTTQELSWRPSHILDFSDLSIGDPLFDLIPIYLDVFRGDTGLLKQFLCSYKLPLSTRKIDQNSEKSRKLRQLSYRVMCCCILHNDNVLGAIFGMWKELRQAESWDEVEQSVWGELNNYQHPC